MGGNEAPKKDKGPEKSSDDQKRLPKCRNPECDEFQYLYDCKNTSFGRKKGLVKQSRQKNAEEKAKQGAKAVRSGDSPDEGLHSALFRAGYAGSVDGVICADIGSYINLLPSSPLREL